MILEKEEKYMYFFWKEMEVSQWDLEMVRADLLRRILQVDCSLSQWYTAYLKCDSRCLFAY